MSSFNAPAANMPGKETHQPVHRLRLRSQLSDLVMLWPWVGELASEYQIPVSTLFSINLCLEEALSNIIRHGYRGQPGHSITVDFAAKHSREIVFTVEDQAPAFDPLSHSANSFMAPPDSMDRLQAGGHGIRLLHKFAGILSYERLASGNRLIIRFPIQPESPATP
jgi:anti-sigma regulatory factor (Ser/Thr protein kinase)